MARTTWAFTVGLVLAKCGNRQGLPGAIAVVCSRCFDRPTPSVPRRAGGDGYFHTLPGGKVSTRSSRVQEFRRFPAAGLKVRECVSWMLGFVPRGPRTAVVWPAVG